MKLCRLWFWLNRLPCDTQIYHSNGGEPASKPFDVRRSEKGRRAEDFKTSQTKKKTSGCNIIRQLEHIRAHESGVRLPTAIVENDYYSFA